MIEQMIKEPQLISQIPK